MRPKRVSLQPGSIRVIPSISFSRPRRSGWLSRKALSPPGDILAQIPAAAQTVALGTPITLLVSSFPMSVAVDAGMVVINLSEGEFIFGVSDFGDGAF